jgi:hypothetical protein
LTLLFGLDLLLLLVGLHCSHAQLRNILFSSQTELGSIGSQLFTLLCGELLGRHPSFSGFGGELLLHGRHLLRAGLAGGGHFEIKIGNKKAEEKRKFKAERKL